MDRLVNTIQADPDSMVIEKILAGDISIFEILIRRYNTALYRIARSYGFNHQDAEDLMQDTHVAAYTELAKFEERASYKTWISRIMINKCLYKLKYGYFKYETPSESVQDIKAEPMHVNPQQNQTEGTVLNRELSLIMEQSIQRLPEMYRTTFMLREIEGFSVAETATLLDISPVNVKVRVNRAKALLQKEIEQFYSRSDLYSFNLVYCDSMVARVFEKIKSL